MIRLQFLKTILENKNINLNDERLFTHNIII